MKKDEEIIKRKLSKQTRIKVKIKRKLTGLLVIKIKMKIKKKKGNIESEKNNK